MVKIILHGCGGRMGRMIAELGKTQDQMIIVAGIDHCNCNGVHFPVYQSLEECQEEGDVVIDFSNAGAVDSLLDYCVDKKLPVVLCTTGLSEEQLAKAEKALDGMNGLAGFEHAAGDMVVALEVLCFENRGHRTAPAKISASVSFSVIVGRRPPVAFSGRAASSAWV